MPPMSYLDGMSDAESRYDRFIVDVKAQRLRLTEQRKAILRVIAGSTDHPDANEVYRRAHSLDRGVSLATVYRTLNLLAERGSLQRHAFDEGRARFEDADREHHDHLIDVDTGSVLEFRSEEIERLQAKVAAELGYEIVRHKLELYGRKRAR